MELKLAAVHEAGHSVMQWLVGWQPRGMEMTVKKGKVINPASDCHCPSVKSLSDIRKRLLVLAAGTAATQEEWPGSLNNKDDFRDQLSALRVHFGNVDLEWSTVDGVTEPAGAQEVFVAVQAKCGEIVNDARIRNAIKALSERFASGTADVESVIRVPGVEVVAICEREIGEEYRQKNPWSDWIEGQ